MLTQEQNHLFEYPPNKKRCIYCGYEQPPWSQATIPPCRRQNQPPTTAIDTEALDQAIRKRINRSFWRSIPEEYWGKELRRNPMTTTIWVGEYRRIIANRNTFTGCTFEGPPKYQNY